MKTKRNKRKSFLRRKFLLFICISIILPLFCFFFSQFNNFVSASYNVKKFEKQIKELSKQGENLETNFVESNHLKSMDDIAKNLNFEKVEKVYYIKAIPDIVAKTNAQF